MKKNTGATGKNSKCGISGLKTQLRPSGRIQWPITLQRKTLSNSISGLPLRRGITLKKQYMNVPPGICSTYVFSRKPGDKVTVSGPYGEFLIKNTSSEMVYIGGGAGMAPLRSHIFHFSIRLRQTVKYRTGTAHDRSGRSFTKMNSGQSKRNFRISPSILPCQNHCLRTTGQDLKALYTRFFLTTISVR